MSLHPDASPEGRRPDTLFGYDRRLVGAATIKGLLWARASEPRVRLTPGQRAYICGDSYAPPTCEPEALSRRGVGLAARVRRVLRGALVS